MDPTVSCLELALEGERLCKTGDFAGGVAFFEAAIKCGTADMKTMSAIYSQMGNAYFYLGNYPKALEYHKLDLNVAKSINDRIGESKASGNLGNTLKMMSQYDSAVTYCKQHLDISRELNDKVGEGRALYNLGNVFHTKAKNLGHLGNHDPGQFPEDVKSCLKMAIRYYEDNLELMIKLGDRSAQGRTYGNLGNTHYLLGNFAKAVEYHNERFKIAIESKDKAAERRAQCNLGNAHIFLGQFDKAVDNYKRTLALAIELNDKIIEAQACYSLGNTYTLLTEYDLAIEYFLRHLKIAQSLHDRIGEGRSFWSIGNALEAMGQHQKAVDYIQKHLDISREIGDLTGEKNALFSIAQLRQKLSNECQSNDKVKNMMHPKRTSMNQLEPIHPNDQSKARATSKAKARAASVELISKSNEDLMDLVSKFQSKRMDDQRCSMDLGSSKENKLPQGKGCASTSGVKAASKGGKVDEDLIDMIAGMQERRMDDQRAALPPVRNLNGLPLKESSCRSHNSSTTASKRNAAQRQFSLNTFNAPPPDDDFFDMLMKCQGNRLEDQRTEMPGSGGDKCDTLERPISLSSQTSSPTFAPTVPDEDFFNLIMRCQSNRLEDQRTELRADH